MFSEKIDWALCQIPGMIVQLFNLKTVTVLLAVKVHPSSINIVLINNFILMHNPQESPKISNQSFENTQALDMYKLTVVALQASLKKSFENRHHNDHQNIQTFIHASPFFKELQLCFSVELAKNIVKRGKIYTVNGNRTIYEKGDRMMRILMPLVGTFYKKDEAYETEEPINQVFSKLEEYIQQAHSTIPLRKKATSMQRRMSVMLENADLRTSFANFKELSKLKQFSNESYPFIFGLEQQFHAQSFYSSGQVSIFAITLESFRTCIFQEYELRLTQKGSYFRKLECFNVLDNQQLKTFVEKIPFIELKKDQYVFREGDPSQNLYLLIQGQAKAQRTVQLFKEDPNCLYRGTCKSQAGRRPQKPTEFSYADFEGVYNYSPQKKRMQLVILAPVTIFGEQQIAAGLPRQADVQITSTKAKMFVFTLKDIEAAGNGKKVAVDQFMEQLFDSITSKRIIVRREGLSNNLELQNRRNMNYFFIQQQSQQTPRRSRTAKQKINRSLSPAIKERIHSPVKPRYHNFNFNQFVSSSKKKGLLKLSTEEVKVANLTHNSGEIQDQIQVSSRLFKQRESYRHKINIATPLFDNNYYKKQRKEILRIENKKRMRLIQVTGVNFKSKSRQLISSAS